MHHVERAAAHVLPRSGKRAHGRTLVRRVFDGLWAIIAKDASDFDGLNPRSTPLPVRIPVLDFFLQDDRDFFLQGRWRSVYVRPESSARFTSMPPVQPRRDHRSCASLPKRERLEGTAIVDFYHCDATSQQPRKPRSASLCHEFAADESRAGKLRIGRRRARRRGRVRRAPASHARATTQCTRGRVLRMRPARIVRAVFHTWQGRPGFRYSRE